MKIHGGVSAYAAGAWDRQTKDAFFKCYPKTMKRLAVATLWGTWSTPIGFIKRFIKFAGDRPHLVEIHISNECARRTGRKGGQIADWLTTGFYNSGLYYRDTVTLREVDKRVTRIVTAIRPLCNKKTKVWLSVGLEDNLNDAAAEVLINYVRALIKPLGWKVVRNPMIRKGVTGEDLTEGHGRQFHPGQDILNFDGIHVGSHNTLEDISYNNALNVALGAINDGTKAIFLWSATAQGWKNQPAQPYEGRTFVISPEEIEGFKSILKNL